MATTSSRPNSELLQDKQKDSWPKQIKCKNPGSSALGGGGNEIINDRETGRSRGFGFVTFKDEDAMRNAIENMNGQTLDGRNITVNEAQSRGSGGGGTNGGGFRGGPRRDGGGYGGSGRGGSGGDLVVKGLNEGGECLVG